VGRNIYLSYEGVQCSWYRRRSRQSIYTDGAPIIVFLCLDTEMEVGMRFEVPTGVKIYITVIRVMTPCSLVRRYQRFRGAHCLQSVQ
jgi:hypothetical protein